MGEAVRYDGGDKYCGALLGELADKLTLVSICPEVAIGLGVPRDPIKLVTSNGQVGVLAAGGHSPDITTRLKNYAKEIADGTRDLSGYIFKARSPSCGVATTPVLSEDGCSVYDDKGSGIFAAALIELLPGLPVADENSLSDSTILAEFIQQAMAYHLHQIARV